MARSGPIPNHLERGRWGEQLAADWYTSHGYLVVARNWRAPIGELDLVVQRRRLIVFCEVKARRHDGYGPPASAVGWAKQRRLRALGAAWLAASGVRGVDVRFDVVAITGTRLDVIEGAF
jgi:putative endonuclease